MEEEMTKDMALTGHVVAAGGICISRTNGGISTVKSETKKSVKS